MRITSTGHAGLFIETAHGSILCDPWRGPSYFGSWFPFPDNSTIDFAALRPDYLYVSHLHRDHIDRDLLRRDIPKSTPVLLPDYPIDELREELAALGFQHFIETRNNEVQEIDGLRLMITTMASPADGPIGDSALSVDDGTARILNQNDSRPMDFDPIMALGAFDGHFLQFSGAIWYPVVYEMPPAAIAALGRRKRANGMERARRFIEQLGARHSLPTSGPACFLDPELFHHNDTEHSDDNIFPDQSVFVRYLEEQGVQGSHVLIPGSSIELGGAADGTVTHPVADAEVERIFSDKRAYLLAYAERAQPRMAAERASRRGYEGDLVAALKEWWEPLLALADNICAGVNAQMLIDTGDSGIVVDFVTREVRAHAGEQCRYTFRIDRELVEAQVADHTIDWVNSLFLSLRFSAARVGKYNEYVYTFFKCLSPQRISYAEGWYAELERPDALVRLGDYMVQRRCPHLKADLSRFGVIADGVLTCNMHGWRFDLETGRCLTSDGHEIVAEHCDGALATDRPAERGAPA